LRLVRQITSKNVYVARDFRVVVDWQTHLVSNQSHVKHAPLIIIAKIINVSHAMKTAHRQPKVTSKNNVDARKGTIWPKMEDAWHVPLEAFVQTRLWRNVPRLTLALQHITQLKVWNLSACVLWGNSGFLKMILANHALSTSTVPPKNIPIYQTQWRVERINIPNLRTVLFPRNVFVTLVLSWVETLTRSWNALSAPQVTDAELEVWLNFHAISKTVLRTQTILNVSVSPDLKKMQMAIARRVLLVT
jgi:hypothetical protein